MLRAGPPTGHRDKLKQKVLELFHRLWQSADDGIKRGSMANKTPVGELSQEELIGLVRELQRQNAGLREEIERLRRA